MSRKTTKMLAAMALGNPLHRIEHVCATQGAITSSRLIRMVDEAQDILKDYAYTINAEAGHARAADKARIAELCGLLEDARTIVEDRRVLGENDDSLIYAINAALAQQGKGGVE